MFGYQNLDDALARTGDTIDRVYQEKCMHSALSYLTPVEFDRVDWML